MLHFKKKKTQDVRRRQVETADSFTFRRSRTLTGSTSNNVQTTVTRPQLQSPRLKENDLKKHRRTLFAGLLLLIVLSSACVWLLDQYIVRADSLISSSPTVKQLDTQRFEKAFDGYLAARPLERFRFLLNQDKLNAYMQQNVPELQSVTVDGMKGLFQTRLTLQLRKPVAVWEINKTNYFVDATGQTFQVNYFAIPAVSVKDESGLKANDAELVVTSSRLLRFLGQTVAGFNNSNVGNVSLVTIPGGTLREVDVTLANRAYRIKTHMDRDPADQVEDAVNAIKYLDGQGVKPEYIDVRVAHKAFYR